MSKCLVPKGFHKLQALKQGSKSVNTCYQELLLLEEVNIYEKEDEETIMDRFYSGLNEKIVNKAAHVLRQIGRGRIWNCDFPISFPFLKNSKTLYINSISHLILNFSVL